MFLSARVYLGMTVFLWATFAMATGEPFPFNWHGLVTGCWVFLQSVATIVWALETKVEAR